VRILIAHSFYRVPGGEDRYVNEQVGLLRPYHQVAVLGPRNQTLAPNFRTAQTMALSPGNVSAVERFITKFQPDVVHLHNPYPSLGPAVHLAAERRRVPLVMTIHNLRLRCPNGLMFTEGQACRRCEAGNYGNAVLHHCFASAEQSVAYATVLWMHRFILRLEDKVRVFVAPSDFMRKRLMEWGISADRVETIRNFVTGRSEASDPPGGFGLYVGRLSSEKGLDTLLEALALAGDPPFRIIGDGPLTNALPVVADRLGLRHTRFVGRIPPEDVGQALRDARYFVMPSVSGENAPLAVLEAMVAGRPVLVSHVGGLPELVEQGAGLSVEPGDAAGMAAKIRELIENDPLCRTLGLRAAATAKQKFSPSGHKARLEALYQRVTDRATKTAI
jgi:glycosyltransferase involved in cell wall biosynthesis